ncbi:MAG: transcription-repair coupling factor, partial [Oscillospiraceae bacterium]|nr:transcription-repair coupling factor [Oscillospiraceae bacterium]
MTIFERLLPLLERSEIHKAVTDTLARGYSPLGVSGISSVSKSVFSLYLCRMLHRQAVVVCEDEAQARRMADDMRELASPMMDIAHFPAKELSLGGAEAVSREYEHERLRVLYSFRHGETDVVTVSAESLMQRTLPPSALDGASVRIEAGSVLDTKELAEKLSASGYTRVDEVTSPAQFAVRGSIFDIWSVAEQYPVRIELWDDEIDTMSRYDPETQRRTDPVDSITVIPALEVFCDAETLAGRIDELAASIRNKKAPKIRACLARDADKLRSGIIPGSIDKYLPLAFSETARITDHGDDPLVIVCEYNNCVAKARAAYSLYTEDVKLLLEQGELCRGLEGYMDEFSSILPEADAFFDSFMRSMTDVSLKRLLTATAYRTSPWGGEIRVLEEDLRSLINRGFSVTVLAGSEKTLPIIAEDLRSEGIPCDLLSEGGELRPGRVLLTTGALSSGFELPDIRTALITQVKALSSKKRKVKKKPGEEIRSLADLSRGDLVVHAMHGIGRFDGISKIEIDDVTKDYITIKYAGTGVLHVPVTQMDLVSRYIGPRDDEGVKLDRLSSGDWQKRKQKAKKAVKDMADELIKLYAARAHTKGHPFPADDDWQHDFEARFDYTETDDQLRCTEEIKADMQRPIPMDRLLCGDVGFGKTEVAFRAAFKCMEDGKQCAILVPTTVLAWQHYQSAVKRFEHFPFTIELLSRFRSKKEQARVLEQLAAGTVDMVIGTHRLVQKDVQFADLGLAVIDEEQRFGVAHKERFKETFVGIDVLTLSATPIPRTLNMAMSGIRDMSVIEEPPVDRYPVQTYVIEHDGGVILQAIQKELRRGGQVYYIHNRVETIDMCAAKLAQALPDARIATAHGQMPEERLSDIWKGLVEQETDILVCTTIIETGVDVANVNTLIIEDADRFGLSQLYQLRGRVGRSNRRAYAYFTFKRGKVLTEVAARRLSAIREFTQFGSGFRIAMRDLEIRGAGSILGGSQHGHMEAVGYDMYIRMLNEAIAEETGKELPPAPEDCLIDLSIDAHIPEDYIGSVPGRLEAYRRIAGICTAEESSDLIDELIDRYGDPPKAILGLINVSLIRNMASKAGVTEISQREDRIYMYIRTAAPEQI